jgi:hypothetical protein
MTSERGVDAASLGSPLRPDGKKKRIEERELFNHGAEVPGAQSVAVED